MFLWGVRTTLPRRRFLHLAAGAAALPAVSCIARADTYPSQPVHVVIGLPPGQSADALAAGMALYPNHTFDAEKDFAPIGLVNTTINTIAGRPTLPPNNFKELLRWMKQPGRRGNARGRGCLAQERD